MSDEVTTNKTVSYEGGAEALPYRPMNIFKGEDEQSKFMEYICSEILDVRDGGDRSDKEAQWQEFRRIRRSKPRSKTRDTPWIKSANVESTLTQQKINAIFAKEVAAFATKKPPMRVEPISSKDSIIAESLERFFRGLSESKYGLNLREVQPRVFYEQVSLGTQFVKVPFLNEQWSFKRTNGDGAVEDVNYIRHQGPACVPIRIEDFFTRPYWKDLQRAPWIGVRYRFFQHELKQKEALGFFENIESLEVLTTYDDNKQEALEQAGISTSSLGQQPETSEYEIYECNVFWDVDGDGYAEDVIAWVYPETRTLLRAEYNPLSVRDIEPVIYLEDPEVIYGIGVAELLQSLQEESTTLRRMRLDGTQLAMLKMFVARTGCGLGPNEDLFPFKMLFVDDVAADFRELTFPDVAPSCIRGEYMVKEDADRVTGASDYMTGFNDKTVGSGASVGGTMFLAQQGNSILNSILQRAEQSWTNIYMLVLYQCMANKDMVDLGWLEPADQANVAQVLSMKVEDIPTKFRFSVRTTDITKTDESRKQDFLTAGQLYNLYGQQIMQLQAAKQQTMQNPPMAETVDSLIVGSTMFMGRLIEFFEIGDPKEFLPYVEDTRLKLRQQDMARDQQLQAVKEQSIGGTEQGGPVGTPTGLPQTGGQLGTQAPGIPGVLGNSSQLGAGSMGGPSGISPF